MFWIVLSILIIVFLIYFRRRGTFSRPKDEAELVSELLKEYKQNGTVSVNKDQAEKALGTIDQMLTK